MTSGGGKVGSKQKGKARAEGLELLANASLKLKAGIHYALIGRNGTGKSSEFWPEQRCTGMLSIRSFLDWIRDF